MKYIQIAGLTVFSLIYSFQTQASSKFEVIDLGGKPPFALGTGYEYKRSPVNPVNPAQANQLRPDTCVSGTLERSFPEVESPVIRSSSESKIHRDVRFLPYLPRPLLGIVSPALLKVISQDPKPHVFNYKTSVTFSGHTTILRDPKWLGSEGKNCGNHFIRSATLGMSLVMFHQIDLGSPTAEEYYKKELGPDNLQFARLPEDTGTIDKFKEFLLSKGARIRSWVFHAGGNAQEIRQIYDAHKCDIEHLQSCIKRAELIVKAFQESSKKMGKTLDKPGTARVLHWSIGRNPPF